MLRNDLPVFVFIGHGRLVTCIGEFERFARLLRLDRVDRSRDGTCYHVNMLGCLAERKSRQVLIVSLVPH